MLWTDTVNLHCYILSLARSVSCSSHEKLWILMISPLYMHSIETQPNARFLTYWAACRNHGHSRVGEERTQRLVELRDSTAFSCRSKSISRSINCFNIHNSKLWRLKNKKKKKHQKRTIFLLHIKNIRNLQCCAYTCSLEPTKMYIM